MWKNSGAFFLCSPSHGFWVWEEECPCLHLVLILHSFPSHSWKGNSKEETAFPAHAQLVEGSSGRHRALPEAGFQEELFPAPRLGSPTFGCTSSTCHLLCAAQGLALAPCQSPNRALCFRWRPKEWQEDVPERESRENTGLHSLSNGSWRHLERQLPNRQGLCQAAVCPGMRSSAHMAERSCTICHTPMPVSSL